MFATLRYGIRLIAAYAKRFKAIILISVVLGAIIFTALLFISPSVFNKKIERIGITGRYYSDNIPGDILNLMSEGLTKINDAGLVEPALAESWETPDKGKTWIFKLKEGLVWQDGTPINSDTIQYDFTDVQIEKPDLKTIIFKLDQPFSPFPAVVSQPIFKKGLLGMKEWKIRDISVAGTFVEKLELINNTNDIKIFRFYPTLERTKLAYKLGEVDVIDQIYDPQPFDKWPTAQVVKENNEQQVVTLFFNTQDAVLSEKSIRQALAYAIDKQSLLVNTSKQSLLADTSKQSLISGNSSNTRAFSSIPAYSWAHNPQVKQYDYDQERAKELIDDLPNEVKEKLEVKLTTTPLLLSTAERIVENWRQIGIKASVQVSTVTPAEYQAFLTVYDIPKDPDQYSTWHSTQTTTNISHYSSPRIDKLLEDGRVLIDTEERRRVYLDFQRFLLEDLPAVFLFNPEYYIISRK